MNSQSFLDLLWGNIPQNLLILIWTLQNRLSYWCRSVPEAADVVNASGAMDTYVGVGLSPEDFGLRQRCPAEKIAGIAGLWADFDIFSEAHPKKALPPTIEDALTVIPPEAPPTITIATGNGVHAWWLFKEPFVFDTDEERARAAAVVYRWQTMLRYNAANRGWAFDRLADLARVLRVPGTTNLKDPNSAKAVAVHEFNDHRYNLSDLEEFLDQLGIPSPESQVRIAQGFTDHAIGDGLVIDLKAEVPDELIRQWAETDPRFHNTWFRQRHDLRDQSQSGYDLALATFGVDAGLAPQQIVDLLIHHRRLHNQKPRTRIDYFQRTLRRAANRTDSMKAVLQKEQLGAESAHAGESHGDAQTSEPKADQQTSNAGTTTDPMMAKVALCESISDTLGIRILRIVKITGKEPSYQIELEQSRIELPSVARLIEQKSLRMAIAGALNKIIPKFKPRVWEPIAQAMLDALFELEGGVETEFEGSMRVHLGHYLTETAFIPDIEGQPSHAIRRPIIIDKQIAVNSVDLQLYLNKTFALKLSVKNIASMLSAIGAQSVRVPGAKIREQVRWLLPVDQFNPIDFTAQSEETQTSEEPYAESE